MPASRTVLSLFAYAPLLPVAAAATAGIVADRCFSIPLPFNFGFAILCFIGWSISRNDRSLAMLPLWGCCIGLAAAYHHASRNLYPADDIGNHAQEEPVLIKVRGTLVEEPVVHHPRLNDPLVSRPRSQSARCILAVKQANFTGIWRDASGRIQLRVEGDLADLHVGDEVEMTGWLSRPLAPMNPGEFDYRSRLLDQRIRAEMHVRKGDEGIIRLHEGWRQSLFGWLAVIRGWGQRTIQQYLPPADAGIASALLLGEGSAMTSDDWDRYVRTGVIHVLAISGQHLVVLGAFLWMLFGILGWPRRRSALVIAITMLAYALLTGGRPSAMRAAIMVDVVCAGILFRRTALPANTFALAWLIVLVLNPTDLFTAGFQLSFLCVAILIWGLPRWFPVRESTELERLVDESRPTLVRMARSFLKIVGRWYLITLVLMIWTAPLVIYWQNVVSPVGVLIGPPAILLTSIALIAGFLLLFASLIGPAFAAPFAWITHQSIAMCEWLVRSADRLPGACWYVPDIPLWWVMGFYGALIVWMSIVRLTAVQPKDGMTTRGFVPVLRPITLALIVAGWASLGLLAGAWKPATDELRISFLAVGHGGCIVLEMPDDRVLLYDVGSLSGPEVTRRQVAPFLWSRGISRIDEVFVSHADLDHFNGLPALADRFIIGQVSWTPSFEQKSASGVAFVAQDLRRRGIPIRELQAGDRFEVDSVRFRVLHPPAQGPAGIENVRSLVLHIEHHGHRVLLTGDLEQQGLDWLLDLPPNPVDVLMAPHHGSRTASPQRLIDWATPRLAIACDGPRPLPALGEDRYTKAKIPCWITWPHGTITLRSKQGELTAETFRTGQRLAINRNP